MSKTEVYNHQLWDHGISQGYKVNGTIYISGQFSHDENGEFIGEDDIRIQSTQTFNNLDKVLKNFGLTKYNIAYIEIYLTNQEKHFEEVMNIYKEYIENHRPAGSSIGVTFLASKQQLIEIRAIAYETL